VEEVKTPGYYQNQNKMLSRVADSLYWMSRYMERTDGILRMLKVNYISSQDDFAEFSWEPVLKIFSFLDKDQINKIKRNTNEVIRFMVCEYENQNSIRNIVTKSRDNAKSVQDHITKEVWQCLNEYYHLVKELNLENSVLLEEPVSLLDNLIKQGMIYYGTLEVTMARGEGLYFMHIGKYLERAIQSIDILNVKFNDLSFDLESGNDSPYWNYLLYSISGYEQNLKTYRAGSQAQNTLHQIMFNENFPRSILYSLNRLMIYFGRLKSTTNKDYHKILFMLGRLHSKVQFSDLETLSETGLPAFLSALRGDLIKIGEALDMYYFSYSQ